MNKFYVTTPIYYVNDRPHIGHAYSTLAADIMARYYRLQYGPEGVFFLTGTDEHGVKIAQAAEKSGQTPQEFCDTVSAQFQLAWDRLNISNNDFIRTTEPRHEAGVRDFLSRLKEVTGPSGLPVIYKGVYEGLYCYGCEAYKTGLEVVDNKCPLHANIELAHLKEENWFFRLSDYADLIKEKIESDVFQILPAGRRKEVLSFIESGLDDIAISRANVPWGIKLPFDEAQTVYVWVDALLNYLTALDAVGQAEKFSTFWPANLQFLAKDILKFHAVIWPAMLLALDLPLPGICYAHGYFTIDGQKMSKSLGNVIDPNSLVDRFGSDAARYLIISQFSFGNDGDIKADDFITKYNSDLANGIGNLVSRVLGMVEKYFDGRVPESVYTADFDLKKFWSELDLGYREVRLYDNVVTINELVKWCDLYIDSAKPWELVKTDPEKLVEVIYNLLELIRQLALAIIPYLPETSVAIWEKLHLENFNNFSITDLLSHPIVPGQSVEKGEPLFLRLE